MQAPGVVDSIDEVSDVTPGVVEDDPGFFAIQPQTALRRYGNFYRAAEIVRAAMVTGTTRTMMRPSCRVTVSTITARRTLTGTPCSCASDQS